MLIGGIQKLSLVDYPGKTSIAIFTIGCNMRCGFCHNAELVLPECFAADIGQDKVLKFLQKRIGLVESVTISGGEPTLQPDLVEFCRQVKQLGYLLKLDSNGTNPRVLKTLIDHHLLDFIAMDIKAPLDKYTQVVNFPIDAAKIEESIALIKSSGLDYEFRTTVVKSLHQLADFDKIGELISVNGKAKRYALQHFRPAKTLDPRFANDVTFSEEDFTWLAQRMASFAQQVVVH